MTLDDRKKSILKAIIDDYINTAEPIGSRAVAKKHDMGLSSATIRNEMADLEDLGYLAQPHTSAGRIPSNKGYRLYVDELMNTPALSTNEIISIQNALQHKVNELSVLISRVSSVLSQITQYTSMAITPEMKKTKINAVQVVPIEPGKALVIVVTNASVVENTIVKISEKILPDDLIKMSCILNEKLKGLAIEDINWALVSEIRKLLGSFNEVLVPVLDGVQECINKIDNTEIYLDGTTNILTYPEFKDVARAREFLSLLETKEFLHKILAVPKNKAVNDVDIRIGTENILSEIKDCSLITTTYSIDNIVIGTLGIIGPTRMNYSRVVCLMDYIKNKINEEIFKLMVKNLDGG